MCRPHWRHLAALLELAEDPGLAHLFTDWTVGEETRGETPTWGAHPAPSGSRGGTWQPVEAAETGADAP